MIFRHESKLNEEQAERNFIVKYYVFIAQMKFLRAESVYARGVGV